jgi:predicted NBD/HSP70 family sugar kinase
MAVFEAAAAGDQTAVAVRDTFAAAVAVAVRLLCLTVDVEVVVIGGGVAQVGDPLRVAVADALRAQSHSSGFLASLELAERLRLVPAGYPVAAVGAALLGRPA